LFTASSDEFGPDFSDYLTTNSGEHQKEENFNESTTNDGPIELLTLLTPAD